MRWPLAATTLVLACVPPAVAKAPVEAPGFTVERYGLALTPDLATKAVAGTETIAFRTTGGLRALAFSPNALTIDSARVGGRPVVVTKREDALVFELPEAAGSGELTIAYHGVPARGLAVSATALYTSYFACDWMICRQDSPGDKAFFALDLRVPEGMTSLAVGRLTEATPSVHRWRTERPYSPYLFGFAVGRFARVEESGLVFLSDVAEPAELRRRLGVTAAMVTFLSEKAGLPLPSPPYTQLVVHGDEAQEAATYAVLGEDALPTSQEPDDWAIVHELAHQWWGNLVTCATWRDFWLNEGITTFLTAAWKEHQHGRAAYEAELDVARARLAKARDKGFDKPLAWDGKYPTLGTRRAVQYSKGALFMDHLRVTLGEDAFWSGLRAYTQAHAGETVTSIDLRHALETASGKDLGAPFHAWVE